MLKKIKVCGLMMAAMLSLTQPFALAAGSDWDCIKDNVTYESQSEQVLLAGDEKVFMPYKTEKVNIDGVPYYYKTYRVEPDFDPNQLREEDFSEDGIRYAYQRTDKKNEMFRDSKTVEKDYELETESNDQKAILEALPESIPYEDEDGWKGEMELQVKTIETVAAENKTVTTPHTQTINKQYTLDYNDPSQVPTSITDGGNTLNRTALTWESTGFVPESEVPEGYIAKATYKRHYSTSYTYTSLYKTTAHYEGDAYLGGIKSVEYVLTYTGTKIPDIFAGIVLPSGMTVRDVKFGITGIALLVGLIVLFIVLYFIRTRTARIYVPNKKNGLFEPIGRQYIHRKNPRIRLAHLQGHEESTYTVVMPRQIAKKLVGRSMAIDIGNGEGMSIDISDFVGNEYSFEVSF